MTGRTVQKHVRFYMDGYDLSGYSRQIGQLGWTIEEGDMTAITDPVKCVLPNQSDLSIGSISGLFDNTATSGLHVVANGAGVMRTVMIPIGMRTDPAQGDPVFVGEFEQKDYMADPNAAGVYATITFDKRSSRSTSLAYSKPWGWLLHAKGAETAVNTAVGIDDNGGATAFGGYLVYQVFAGNGTATIKVQDAATNTNPSFADLSGATTGSIDCSSVKYGVVAIGTTATVRQYLRWQIVLGSATTVTFALAFVRATF